MQVLLLNMCMDKQEFEKILTDLGVTIVHGIHTKTIVPNPRLRNHQLISVDGVKFWTNHGQNKVLEQLIDKKYETPKITLTTSLNEVDMGILRKKKRYYARKKIDHKRLFWGRGCLRNPLHRNKDGLSYKSHTNNSFMTNGTCLMCLESFVDVPVEHIEEFAKGIITRKDIGL